MRTSNKIILGIFVAPLIVLAALNLTLYAKYKSGNYVTMEHGNENRVMRLVFTHVMSVAVYGLDNFSIVPADTAALEIEKQDNNRLRYVVQGDSLVIHGDSLAESKDNGGRNYRSVKLYLPGDASIIAHNSDVDIDGSKDSLKASSYHFYLNQNSSFNTREHEQGNARFFKSLQLQATGSSDITLHAGIRVRQLMLQLEASEFKDEGASVDSVSVIADKKSLLTLRGDKIQRLHH